MSRFNQEPLMEIDPDLNKKLKQTLFNQELL